MPRNSGADIDITSQRVCDRDGRWYPLDRLAMAGSGLFYERPLGSRDPQDRLPEQLFFYHQPWILPDQGWVVNRMTFFADVPDPFDWYIEPYLISVDGDTWRIRDAYLDVEVYEGLRYHVDDAHELAHGLRAGEIPLEDAVTALEALHDLYGALKRLDFSGRALLEEFAPVSRGQTIRLRLTPAAAPP